MNKCIQRKCINTAYYLPLHSSVCKSFIQPLFLVILNYGVSLRSLTALVSSPAQAHRCPFQWEWRGWGDACPYLISADNQDTIGCIHWFLRSDYGLKDCFRYCVALTILNTAVILKSQTKVIFFFYNFFFSLGKKK